MKTAIAVPDAIFARVEHRVRALGMSRSEFFSRAAERYLRDLDREDLTARIDASLESTGAAGSREQAEWATTARQNLGSVAGDDW
jgi:metal-responsive CopG/Arc/MetJ family transcriptional regulator